MPRKRKMVSAAVPARVVAKCNFHLDAVGESYGQHLRAAVSIALRLAKASGACVLHALIPGLCTRVASKEVAKLHAELMRRSDACEQLRRARSAGETQLRNVEIESS